MKYTDFKKMSSRERKAYLKAGGKVETTSCKKTAIYMKFAAVTAFIVWGSVTLLNKHSGDDGEKIARHLVSMCVTDVGMKLKDPSSLTRDRVNTTTRLTNAGFTVDFNFTANNSFGAKINHSARCLFDADQNLLGSVVK